MDKRLMHYEFPRDQIRLDGNTAEYRTKVAAVVEDSTDAAIVAAILAAARAEGVTDLYLMDKTFILDALREKLEREKPKPMTNADRIRAMNDKELAAFICDRCNECSRQTCPGAEKCNGSDGRANGLVKWLQEPAEEDPHGE